MKLDITTFKPNGLTFSKEKIATGQRVDISYNNQDILLQFPSSKVLFINSEKGKCEICVSFDVDDNFEYYKFLQIFNFRIQDYIGDIEYKPGHVENSVVENGFKKNKIIVKLKTTQKTRYYDRQKKKMSNYEINVGDTIIPLVETKGIFMDKKEANQRWTAKQILKL